MVRAIVYQVSANARRVDLGAGLGRFSYRLQKRLEHLLGHAQLVAHNILRKDTHLAKRRRACRPRARLGRPRPFRIRLVRILGHQDVVRGLHLEKRHHGRLRCSGRVVGRKHAAAAFLEILDFWHMSVRLLALGRLLCLSRDHVGVRFLREHKIRLFDLVGSCARLDAEKNTRVLFSRRRLRAEAADGEW